MSAVYLMKRRIGRKGGRIIKGIIGLTGEAI